MHRAVLSSWRGYEFRNQRELVGSAGGFRARHYILVMHYGDYDMGEHMKAGTPHADDLFAQFPALRARVAELERRLNQRAPMVAARVRADLTSDSWEELATGGSAAQPIVIRSIIDLVEGRSLLIEDALGTVLGLSELELMQSSFLDRVHPEDRLRTMHVLQLLAGGQVLEAFRIRHRHADGTYLAFEWAAVADDAGEQCYAIAIVVTD